MTHKKPDPLVRGKTREPCPVCGEISYSRAGVHPQCEVQLADAERAEQIRHNRQAAEKPATSNSTRWQKTCPRCKASQHVRRKTCDCGHAFSFPDKS